MAMFAIPTALVFLGVQRLALGERFLSVASPVCGLAGLAGMWVALILESNETPAQSALGICLGLAANVSLTALVLRLIGFRLVSPSHEFGVVRHSDAPGPTRALRLAKLASNSHN
jgi:hypothetical protein